MGKRLYVIAGEASGDLHGGNLIKELFRASEGDGDVTSSTVEKQRSDPTLQPSPFTLHPSTLSIRAWGGDRMQAAGATVVKHYRDLAFMGFTQVVMNLRTILRNIDTCKADILAFKPDALILIDYPGFNLRIAEWAHGQGIPVHYYISPQVWAWKAGRVKTIKRVVDYLYVILPFEKAWYAERGMDVEFVGHPLLDEIAAHSARAKTPLPGEDGRPIVALLPGSRRQEITEMLATMLTTVKHFPQHRFVVAAAPSVPAEFYQSIIGDAPVTLIADRTYDILAKASAALVTSGTATLETALFGVPEAVCYGGGAVNVWLAKRLIKINFISLVNLIMDREVVRELIQKDMTPATVRAELDRLLNDSAYRERMLQDLSALREKLGGPGASARVAHRVWKSLEGRA